MHAEAEPIAYIDINSVNMGETIYGKKLILPNQIFEYEFDNVVIAVASSILQKEILLTLKELGISEDKIINIATDCEFMDLFSDQRTNFIEGFAKWLHDNNLANGSVAECGVSKGDCARFINRSFPEHKCYLFDTFDGFNKKDLDIEDSLKNPLWKRSRVVCEGSIKTYRNIDISYVLSRMPFKDKIIVRKGFFPDTVEGIKDEFCFVNLDMDLYQPMLEGLRFFYDRVIKGGGILLHDYYNMDLGVRKAIEDFETERGIILKKIPIGDKCSIFILK